MEKFNKFTIPLLNILIGILLLVFKGGVIKIALTVVGVAFIVFGIVDLLNKQKQMGIARLIVGAIIIVFGYFLTTVAIYIIAVLLVLGGVLSLGKLTQARVRSALHYVQPILLMIIGLCLLFHQGAAVSWVFIVAGVAFVLNGILELSRTLK